MGHLPDVSMNRTNIWLKPPPRFHWSCTNEVPKTLHLSCKQTKSHLGSSEFIHCHRNVSNFQQQKAIWTLEHRKRNDQIIIHHIPIYTLKCLKRLLFQSSPIRSSGEFFSVASVPLHSGVEGQITRRELGLIPSWSQKQKHVMTVLSSCVLDFQTKSVNKLWKGWFTNIYMLHSCIYFFHFFYVHVWRLISIFCSRLDASGSTYDTISIYSTLGYPGQLRCQKPWNMHLKTCT